jgi:hypothetical protein
MLGVAAMTDLDQLVFDFEPLYVKSSAPEIKRNVSAGAPRLLRRLLAIGLDPAALEHAAALCVALDAEPTS